MQEVEHEDHVEIRQVPLAMATVPRQTRRIGQTEGERVKNRSLIKTLDAPPRQECTLHLGVLEDHGLGYGREEESFLEKRVTTVKSGQIIACVMMKIVVWSLCPGGAAVAVYVKQHPPVF